jgi:hypothetical protein
MSQSTYLAHDSHYTTVDTRVFAPVAFERIFDTLNGQQPTPAPGRVKATTYSYPAAVIGTGAAGDTSPSEVVAVKTAQLVAERLAEETLAAMADLGGEFDSRAYVRHAGRAVAEMMAASLQALPLSRRVEVAARAVDPANADEDLDVVLDSVGRMLSVYSEYLPGRRWAPMALRSDGGIDARVVGWRGPEGQVVFDLLDTFGSCDEANSGGTSGLTGGCTGGAVSDEDVSSHRDEMDEVIRRGRDLFDSDFIAVRYLPTFQMRHARVSYANGFWDPFGKAALPALRLIK